MTAVAELAPTVDAAANAARSIIGTVLVEEEIPEPCRVLDVDDLVRLDERILWQLALALKAENQPVTLPAVETRAHQNGVFSRLPGAGGEGWHRPYVLAAVTSDRLPQLVELVRAEAIRRRIERDATTLLCSARAGRPAAELVEDLARFAAQTSALATTTAPTVEPETIALSAVEPRRVGWLWFGRLPSGEMVVITGRPGVGKGLLLCYIVARYTTGRLMHGDRAAMPAGNVLWISMEDAHDTALVPRIIAAGGDRSRVHAWNLAKPLSLPEDADRIVAELKRHGCTLLIIDPAPTLLDKDHSSNNDANVRQSFAALSAACRELGCTMILVRHTNKRSLGDAMDRGGGSIGWSGMPRIEMMLGRRPVEESATVADVDQSVVTLATVKNNLGRWAPSLNLAIVEAGDSARIEVIGETDSTADDLCAQQKPHTARKTSDAEEIIRRTLADGEWHRQREVMDAAEQAEIGERTLKRAKASLQVQSQQRSDGWWWRLRQGAKGDTVAPWPPGPLGEVVPLPSYNNEHLGSQRAIGPQTPPPGTVTSEGQTALPLPTGPKGEEV